MKRLLSIFVAMLMVTTMLVPSIGVFAEETETAFDPFAGDYVKGEMPVNLITSPSANSFWYNSRSYQNSDTKNDVSTGVELYTKSEVSVSSHYAGAGFLINTGKLAPAEYALGEHYVFAFATRNLNLDIPAKLHMGIWNGTYSGTAIDILEVPEYEDGIVDITNDGEWNEIKVTLPAIPELTSSKTSYAPSIRFGFVNGTPANARIELNSNHTGVLKPYISKEVPHDITISALADATVIKGFETKYQAKLLNQVDSTGYLAQDFTYTVFGADGNAVEGLNVANTDDVAVISATDAVADGTYYLRATTAIDAETTWQKTIAFTVAGAIENTDDHVKGELNDNIVNPNNPFKGQTAGAVAWGGQNLPLDVTADMGTQYYTTFKTSSSAYTNSDYWGVGGSFMLDKNTSASFVPEENTTYVLEATVRSLSGEQYLNLVYTSGWNLAKTRYSNEYGSEGKKIGTEWETFKATVTTSTTSANANGILLGLRKTPANDYLIMNHSAGFYFAKEKAHDINVKGPSASVNSGETLNLEAELLNQIGTKGTLTQSFDWVAVTEDRLSYVDGITFTETNDGANVTVNVADTVDAGDYIIVAQNKTYGMNRQYPITVTVPTYDVTELTVTTTSSSASVEDISVNATEDVMVVIAAYNGNRVVKASKTVITPVEGVATLSEDDVQKLTLSELTAGNKVRVFVWTADDYTPLTMKAADKAPKTIE